MHALLAQLVLYSDLAHDPILEGLGQATYRSRSVDRVELTATVNALVKKLLDVATLYGFDGDLWRDYLAYKLLTCENSFSLTTERRGVTPGGSVNQLAVHDLDVLLQIMRYDLDPLAQLLNAPALTAIRDWTSIPKAAGNYHAGIAAQVRALSDALAGAVNGAEAFELLTQAYERVGVGFFGLNSSFRIRRAEAGEPFANAYVQPAYRAGALEFVPVNNTQVTRLEELVGYERQKEQLVANTEAFLAGRPANDALLYGDAGTGKSTSVKALAAHYYDRGLRLVEVYKHQCHELPAVIEAIKHRNYRFVVFIDDLSFESEEVEYKYLKAVLEGGVESRPENVLVYATSNRRHLIRETWNDRNDRASEEDLHHSDTVEEKLSLSARFGLAIRYDSPNRKLYHDIVLAHAQDKLADALANEVLVDDLPLTEERLLLLADRWEIRHGGVSGRVAEQFVDDLAGRLG